MGRVTGSRSSYGHRITRVMGDCYRLSWSFDVKLKGSRLRWPRTMTRDTDEAGALRFAKKWNIAMPNDKFSDADRRSLEGMVRCRGNKC